MFDIFNSASEGYGLVEALDWYDNWPSPTFLVIGCPRQCPSFKGRVFIKRWALVGWSLLSGQRYYVNMVNMVKHPNTEIALASRGLFKQRAALMRTWICLSNLEVIQWRELQFDRCWEVGNLQVKKKLCPFFSPVYPKGQPIKMTAFKC